MKASPLGGGTTLAPDRASLAAVLDLRDLALDTFTAKGGVVTLGATLTLQGMLEQAGKLPDALIESIRHEVGWNLRNAATVAGTLVAADGRSPLLTTLLVLDGVVSLEPGKRRMALDEFLPQRAGLEAPYLITSLEISLVERLAYSQVARTPMDQPIVCVSAARTTEGAIRLAAGGFRRSPAATACCRGNCERWQRDDRREVRGRACLPGRGRCLCQRGLPGSRCGCVGRTVGARGAGMTHISFQLNGDQVELEVSTAGDDCLKR